MKYKVLHPFLDKYHPEDIYYPGEVIVVEDEERLKDLMELELLKPCKNIVSDFRTFKSGEEEKTTKKSKKKAE